MLCDELHSLRRAVRFRRQKRVRQIGVATQRRAVMRVMRHVVKRRTIVVVVLVETALATLIELARRVVEVRELHDFDLVGFVVGQRVVAMRGRDWGCFNFAWITGWVRALQRLDAVRGLGLFNFRSKPSRNSSLV